MITDGVNIPLCVIALCLGFCSYLTLYKISTRNRDKNILKNTSILFKVFYDIEGTPKYLGEFISLCSIIFVVLAIICYYTPYINVSSTMVIIMMFLAGFFYPPLSITIYRMKIKLAEV